MISYKTRLFALLFTTLLILFVANLQANDTSASDGTTASQETDLNPLQQRISQLQADQTMDQEQKQKLITVYKSTLEQNRSAAAMVQKTEEFSKAKDKAAEKIAALKQSLEQTPSEELLQVPDDITLEKLNQLLSTEEGKLQIANKLLEDVQGKIEFRKKRKIEMLELSANANNRLQEISGNTEQISENLQASEFDKAVIEQTKAFKKALQQEISLYQIESDSYQAESELLRLRKDSANLQIQQAQKQVNYLQGILNSKRKQEAEQAVKEAAAVAVDLDRPAVKHIAEENSRLAELRSANDSAASKIISVTDRSARINKKLKSITEEQRIVEQKIDAAGLNRTVGILLQKQKKNLPKRSILKANISKTQSEITLTQQTIIEIEEKLLAVDNIEEKVSGIRDSLDAKTSEYEKKEVEKTARNLLQTQREYLDALLMDNESYFNKLYDLYDTQTQLLKTTDNFKQFINENILWFRTYNPVWRTDYRTVADSAKWLFSKAGFQRLIEFLRKDINNNLAIYILGLLVSLIAIIRIPHVKKRLLSLSNKPEQSPAKLFKYTLKALFYSVQLSFALAVPLLFIWWRIIRNTSADDYCISIASGILAVATIWFTFDFLCRLFYPEGLGPAHLKWKAIDSKTIALNIKVLRVFLIPAIFIFAALQYQSNEEYQGSLGRIAFILSMLIVSFCIYKVLFHLQIVQTSKLNNVLILIFVLIPISLAFIALMGFFYTAYILAIRLLISLWLILAVVITDSLLKRSIYLVKWNMAVKKHQQRSHDTGDKSEMDKAVEKAQEVKISDLGDQARTLRRMFRSLLLIAGLWLIWVEVLPALSILDNVVLWSHTAKQNILVPDEAGNQTLTTIQNITPVTLADLLLSIGVVIVTLIATRNIPGLLEITMLRRLPFEFGTKFAITTVFRYLIIIAGAIIALSMLSIGWSKVQWLAAGISVGLGFGLQEIFSNFISGLIILFEQPIRIGDTVTVGDVSGIITKIKSRATTITTWERKELIVPNKEFITSRLVNWSLSDNILRVEVPVGIAYGSDTQKAYSKLMEVATNHPMVIADPDPQVLFLRFDDSALYFEVRVYTKCIDSFLKIKHELHMQIDQALRDADITIAFPQRDIHIKTIDGQLPKQIVPQE